MGGRVGSDKLCPIQSVGSAWEIEAHCYEKCEWFDGEGCAIWRIVKALERLYIIRIEKPESVKIVGKGGDSK